MSESKLGDKTLKVDHVLNIAEESLLCYTLIDVLNTREKACIRKVMPAGIDYWKGVMRDGFDMNFYVKVYVEECDHSTAFTAMLDSVNNHYAKSNISIPMQGIHIKRDEYKEIFAELLLYLMDGANRATVCKKLYLKHKEQFPGEEKESERVKWRYIPAKMYRATVKPILAMIAKATNLQGQQTLPDDNFSKIVYHKCLCAVSDVIFICTLPLAHHCLCSQQAFIEWNNLQPKRMKVTQTNIANYICMIGGRTKLSSKKKDKQVYKGAKAVQQTVAASMGLDDAMMDWIQDSISQGYGVNATSDQVPLSILTIKSSCTFSHNIPMGQLKHVHLC
jgi:hypothetical protein